MNTPRRCIISYASLGRENYPHGMKRMIRSALKQGHGGSPDKAFLLLSPDIDCDAVDGVSINKSFPSSIKFPTHKEIPYGFKPWLFMLARNLGFEQVLWCDSTIVIHKNLEPIWHLAETRGLFVANNPGCPQAFYTSDDAADKMGQPRDAMFDEIMACSLAIDFRDGLANLIFEEWFALCNDGVTFAGKSGSSRPEFKAHRHDQSAMSWLVEKHKIQKEDYGLLTYHGSDMLKFPHHVLANTGVYQA